MGDIITVISAIFSAFFGGAVVAFINYHATKKKIEVDADTREKELQAEAKTRDATARRIEAEAEKLRAEADSIRRNVKGIEAKQFEVGSDIETIKFLIASMLPSWELDILSKIASSEEFTVETNSLDGTFRRDLGDLWGRGFIKQKRLGDFLPNQGMRNVKDYYEIDKLGRHYLSLREKYLGPVKPMAEV